MAELLREWQGQMKGSLILDQELLKDKGEERERGRIAVGGAWEKCRNRDRVKADNILKNK